MCPFGVGCQLSGSQGGGISDSASRGKGDLPFPHENRRDVTVCGVSMFFIAVGWTASASAGQDPLSLPGSCLPGNCRRSATYGYGRLRLSDAGEAGEKGGLFWLILGKCVFLRQRNGQTQAKSISLLEKRCTFFLLRPIFFLPLQKETIVQQLNISTINN